MLDMFGGVEALEPLRDPFKKEFEGQLSGILSKIDISSVMQQEVDFETFKSRIGNMVDVRLDELTPKHVKEIIADMIRQHLGWLVVWGGVFGAFIGFLSTLLL
ncbi:MAG: DUF445 domain-containing protein, partial [Candidatus Scalindua sp.]|nr:DUF445 domain-containing protein [Candidatus Scalindua sp.]